MGDELGLRRAEELRQYRVGIAELVGGVDEVGGGAKRRPGADRGQDRSDTVAMREHALAGRQLATDDQRLGEGARLRHLVARARESGALEQANDRRRGAAFDGRSGSHGAARATTQRSASRNSRTTATWSAATSVGTWPTPAN